MDKGQNESNSVIVQVGIVRIVYRCLPHLIWACCIAVCVYFVSSAFAGKTTIANFIAAFSLAVDTGCSIWHMGLTCILAVLLVVGFFVYRHNVADLKRKNEEYKQLLQIKK